MWGILGGWMPRSGGSYAYNSRILRPWIQTAATFRSLLPIAVFSIVLLTLLHTGLFTVRNSAIPIVFVVASMVVLLGLVVSDLGARTRISAFERENRDPAEDLLLYHRDYKNGENAGTVRYKKYRVRPARTA